MLTRVDGLPLDGVQRWIRIELVITALLLSSIASAAISGCTCPKNAALIAMLL